MFKKTLLAVATVAATFGAVAATTGTASAGNYNNHYGQHLVCTPVFQWQQVWDNYRYRYITIKVKVRDNCYWVSDYTPRHNRRHYWNY